LLAFLLSSIFPFEEMRFANTSAVSNSFLLVASFGLDVAIRVPVTHLPANRHHDRPPRLNSYRDSIAKDSGPSAK
jgi:hypothetical protein